MSAAHGDTIGAMISRVAARVPDHAAITVRGGATVTYRELDERSTKVANALLARGLRPGDRVAAWLETCPEYIELYLAVAKAGMVMVPINALLTYDEAAHQVVDSGARAIVYETAFGEHVDRFRDSTQVELFVERSDTAAGTGYETLVAEGTLDAVPPPGEDDLYIIAYTSGTTGTPKGAMLTHRSVKNVCRVDSLAFRLPIDSVCAYQANMSFVATVTALIMVHLYLGGTVAITGKVDVDEFLDVIEEVGATFVYIPTPWIAPFADAARQHPTKWRTVQSVVHAASKADPAHVQALVDVVGDRYMEGWGMTENSGALVTVTRRVDMWPDGSEATDVWSSVGRPVVEAVVDVIDEDGRPLPHDGESVGELIIQAASIMAGYWNNPDATTAALQDGWYHTGDLGSIDEAGYVYITERRTDLIISGGLNVYPSELEHVIERLDAVSEVAVVGLPHERWGQTPVAVVVPTPGATLSEDDVMEQCRTNLASYKKPTRVVFWDGLPRTASNKVRRQRVREMLVEDDARR